MATIIRTNGNVEIVQPANGTNFSLDELNGIVGGFIEIVQIPSSSSKIPAHLLVCNEEGKLKGLPINYIATGLYGFALAPSDFLVGDVLICPTSQIL